MPDSKPYNWTPKGILDGFLTEKKSNNRPCFLLKSINVEDDYFR